MAKTTMGRAPRPHEEAAARRRPTYDATATGSDRYPGIDRTRDGNRPADACELFQAAELERMGLLPKNDTAHVGALFVGDGTRASGWYHAWAGNGFTVVTCDFTMLVDTLFGIDTRRYLTMRRMREARLLLACGSTVEHAARAVGYRSPTSFSAAFARAHGMSPSQWRAASRMNVAQVADA